MNDTTAHVREMVEAAQDFCLLIEYSESYEVNLWLADLARILPRIQAAMAYLDEPDIEYSFFALPDLEERFELFCRLKDQLGGRDEYRLEYDVSSESEEMSGSLADDLADMYFELKRGLNLYQSDRENQEHALKIWQIGYLLHWGQHLVDAQKHLFSLRVEHQYNRG